MAKDESGVWGIEIGVSAIKALRCVNESEEENSKIVATAFDYIEYTKILSEQDAEPTELIREALEQFLSRNEIKGDKVAISVAGERGLAKFISLPPVEASRIPDIIKYEAKQQIPFSLEEVVWDYQQMMGASEEDGFILETEVGLFAIKHDQVIKALTPFTDAKIDVDIIQLVPETLYNYAVFDLMKEVIPPPDEYDPDEPPDWTLILSFGCDNTDLIATNGFQIWQSNIRVGGNNFTKALMEEFDLTFAKAEHLKRNATTSSDPKAVFQAMRPIFNDLVKDCQHKLRFFHNLHRDAEINKVIGIGNVMKLPGIRTYISQNLEYEVERIEEFKQLTGAPVVQSPAFQENLLSFVTAYGLCIQGLEVGKLKTNLIPREVVVERIIRDKKPWALAGSALLMLGLTIGMLGYWVTWSKVQAESWADAESAAESVQRISGDYKGKFDSDKSGIEKTKEIGDSLVDYAEGRFDWLELYRIISAVTPHEVGKPTNDVKVLSTRNQIHITNIEPIFMEDVGVWYSAKKTQEALSYAKNPTAAAPAAAEGAEAPAEGEEGAEAEPTVEAPTGPGWIIQLTGFHFHHVDGNLAESSAGYVQKTLIAGLQLPYLGDLQIGEFGIKFPVIMDFEQPIRDSDPSTTTGNYPPGIKLALDDGETSGSGSGASTGFGMAYEGYESESSFGAPPVPSGGRPPGVPQDPEEEDKLKLTRFVFRAQFIWQPVKASERAIIKQKRINAEILALEEAKLRGEIPATGVAPQPGRPPVGAPVPGSVPAPGTAPQPGPAPVPGGAPTPGGVPATGGAAVPGGAPAPGGTPAPSGIPAGGGN